MFRLCREKYFTNYINQKKLKIINKNRDLLNINAETFLGVQSSKHLSDSHKFKSSGRQSLMQLSPTTEKNHLCSRNIHNSVTALSMIRGENQRKEEIRNYIFCSVLGGICLAMFIFSLTMRTHEDYVVVNPDNKKK